MVAKISGLDNGPKLMFGPSYVDVVPVTKPEDWSIDPFEGIIEEGFVWGRGALDMLFIVVSQLRAFVKLHQENFKPKGDLVLLFVADEEQGGHFGIKWMLDNHPDLIMTNYAVSERGSEKRVTQQ